MVRPSGKNEIIKGHVRAVLSGDLHALKHVRKSVRLRTEISVVIRPLRAVHTDTQAVETGVAGYQVRAFEKGRIATPVKAWEDPYQVAADAHSLVSRRNDPVRLFNAGMVSCRCSVALSGGTTLLELVNYSARAPAHAVTVALEAAVVSARVSTLENPAPARIEPVRSKHGVELPLPPFAVWAAVELNPKEGSHA